MWLVVDFFIILALVIAISYSHDFVAFSFACVLSFGRCCTHASHLLYFVLVFVSSSSSVSLLSFRIHFILSPPTKYDCVAIHRYPRSRCHASLLSLFLSRVIATVYLRLNDTIYADLVGFMLQASLLLSRADIQSLRRFGNLAEGGREGVLVPTVQCKLVDLSV